MVSIKSGFDYLSIQELFKNYNSFSSSLFLVYFDAFGPEGLYWHPVVIREQINKLISEFDVSEHNFQKLLTAIYIHITTDYFKKPFYFNIFSQILNNKVINPNEIFQLSSVYDMAWGITEAKIIFCDDPNIETSDIISKEIANFIELNLLYNSFLVIPSQLRYKDSVLIKEDLIKENFSPELQQAILQHSFEESSQVEEYVIKRKEALIEEYLRLPLKNGSVEDIVAKIAP